MHRAHYLAKVEELSRQFPVVCLLGARQVGKTTLARQLSDSTQDKVHLFDLENDQDLAALEQPLLVLGALEGLIIIDEIQRRPNLFPTLRVLVDTPGKMQRWLNPGQRLARLTTSVVRIAGRSHRLR